MNPEERKAKSEALLLQEGIPLLPSLPCIESEEETELRTAEEVGIRICCLYCVSGYAFTSDSMFQDYLRAHSLWEYLTPDECAFMSNSPPDRQLALRLTWRCEALFLLMWAVQLFEQLHLPRTQISCHEIQQRFPAADQSPWPFVRGLRLRAKSELLDVSDLIYRLHWSTRQAELSDKPYPSGLDGEVVMEWHYAINWLTRVEDEDWDDVNTHT